MTMALISITVQACIQFDKDFGDGLDLCDGDDDNDSGDLDEEEDGVVHVGLVTIILGFQLSAFPENLVKKSFQS